MGEPRPVTEIDPHLVARELVDAIVDAGVAGRDPVTRAELEIVIAEALRVRGWRVEEDA